VKQSRKQNPDISGQNRTKADKSGQTRTSSGPEATASPEPGAPKLNFNQQRALVALFEAPSIAAAARHTGVNERTLRRWLHDDAEFQDELRQMRQQYLAHAATRLQSTANEAVQTLLDLLASKDHIEPGRAALVRTALDFAFRAGSYTDLADRIEELEYATQNPPDSARAGGPSASNNLSEDAVD
jgi:hypothetical protein